MSRNITLPLDAGDELEALLDEGDGETTEANSTDVTDDEADGIDELDSLDALLAESMTSVKEERAAKAARDRLKRGGQTAQQKAEDIARIRAWELAHEWQAVANVAFFERHECDCGHHYTIFRQLMLRQQHRTQATGQRWERVDELNPELPNETIVQRWTTPMCVRCAPGEGFPWKNVAKWENT